jgi:hypothetical protein
MAQKGTIGWDKRNGHPLKGEFDMLFMLKAGFDYEFFGFRHAESFYVTNGAPKKTGKKGQVPDYRIAKRILTEFVAALRRK